MLFRSHWPENTYSNGYLPTPVKGQSTVMVCPSSPVSTQRTWWPTGSSSFRDFTYGMSDYRNNPVEGWQKWNDPANVPGWRLGRIVSPDTQVLAADSREATSGITCFHVKPRHANALQKTHTRHFGRANILCADGHVVPAGQFDLADDYGFLLGSIVFD